MPSPIYYITDTLGNGDCEEKSSANAMAKLHGGTVQPFFTSKTNFFGNPIVTKAPTTIPKEIILLAHTDSERPPSTIGGKSPKDLAADFANMFPKKQNKSLVTDIFLISCEAGMGTPSLAQQFATAMVAKDFKNIKIHAVAHPEGKLIGGGVEVTTKPGTLTGGTPGQVTGYFYGNQESKEYHQYKTIKLIAKRTAEEHLLYEQLEPRYDGFDPQKAVIVNLVTDLDDMRDPYNTFTKKGPESMISADMAITLNLLKRKRNAIIEQHGPEVELVQLLNALITRLKTNATWQHTKIMTALKYSLPPNHQVGLFSRGARAFGVDSTTDLMQAYANELNTQLNTVNHTSHKNIKLKHTRDTNITETSPLLGASSQPQSIQIQLRQYATQRGKEEWGFSWDFLYLKTFSFWMSDCVTSLAKNMGVIKNSTDYLNIKYRDTKISAARKLAEIMDGHHDSSSLTLAERGALSEGRLNLIANAEGTLDDILSEDDTMSPMHDSPTSSRKNK